MSAGTRIGSDVPFCEGALTEATSIKVPPAGPAPRFNAGSGASRPRCRKRRSARDVVLQRSSRAGGIPVDVSVGAGHAGVLRLQRPVDNASSRPKPIGRDTPRKAGAAHGGPQTIARMARHAALLGAASGACASGHCRRSAGLRWQRGHASLPVA